jgi:hypothetical protein
MTVTLTYQVDKGVALNDVTLLWDLSRAKVRQLLGDTFQEDNQVIDLSQFHNGTSDFNIVQRRDIYRNYRGQDNYFFLNYDREDNLRDVEVHQGLDILIQNVKFNFETDFQEVMLLLKSVSSDNIKISDGEYFFKDLKLTISDGEAMGGEGHLLSYFYCTKDVEHLTN